ncbi:MAG: cytochrome b N-terminal domain-containing protein [Candidatus Marinimicrobia bacterium]|nr:cytochrome b N-terminal domain-containing protein [Candidatus Neomarinimicrobiota bacterium]
MLRAGAIKEWAVESFPFDLNILKELSSEPIPNHLKRWWFAIGGTPMYLFMIQAITGIFLTFYYVPHPAEAYNSIAYITTEVRFGWFIRSIHKWSAHLMIFTLMLHMMRVFFTGAYRRPRELNWMFGVCLLLITFGFGFTGYSLLYEQVSYWASVVGANIAAATPFIGDDIGNFLRGGNDIGPNTLTRFFVLHIGVLPTAMVVLLGLHVLQIRLHGITTLQFKKDRAERENPHAESFPFYPNHFYTELILGLFLTFLLTILALVYPAEMGERANPLVTPEHIKPEWFFYAMFRWLKLTSLQVGVMGTMIFMGMLMFWPFIDRVFERKWPGREISFWLGVLGFIIFLVFTIWEAVV